MKAGGQAPLSPVDPLDRKMGYLWAMLNAVAPVGNLNLIILDRLRIKIMKLLGI
jgi:hypothetical protein